MLLLTIVSAEVPQSRPFTRLASRARLAQVEGTTFSVLYLGLFRYCKVAYFYVFRIIMNNELVELFIWKDNDEQ